MIHILSLHPCFLSPLTFAFPRSISLAGNSTYFCLEEVARPTLAAAAGISPQPLQDTMMHSKK
jgi:hypothetical protein